MRFIVIDKSWLQGVPEETIAEIAATNRLLMPAVLMYELFTTSDEAVKTICFRKLIRVQKSIDLLEHVGSFLRFESEKQMPCTPIQNRRLPIVFEFNPRLKEPNYPFTNEQRESIEYFHNQWEIDDVKSFKPLAAGVTVWFPELEGMKAGSSFESIQPAIDKLIKNTDKVKEIYKKLSTTRNGFFPSPEMVDENWAFFRWLQVYLVYALEYIRKYGAGNIDVASKSMPNDRLDIQYLITGTLAKALATGDKIMRKYFELCCPDGQSV
ncbi:MAG: hypothetical protein ACE5I5_20440 [Candidatus Heimdallarchaeota archaeon]